jgi:branched-chain amino acid aminotransferase
MNSICVNGKIRASNEPALFADDKGYRYGDGLFETMKMINGRITFIDLHLDRLFNGLHLMQFKIHHLFTRDNIIKDISALSKKNECASLCRIRLSVSRGNGTLYDDDNHLNYIIECWPLTKLSSEFKENGLVIGLYEDSKKSCDAFCNLKSANCLPYSMAALFAKQNQLHDALILNMYNRICDSTISNIFWVKKGELYTNPLSEGCIDGIMRKFLLKEFEKQGENIHQKPVDAAELEDADEIFLTNAVKGIRWVKNFRAGKLTNTYSLEIYERFIKSILD